MLVWIGVCHGFLVMASHHDQEGERRLTLRASRLVSEEEHTTFLKHALATATRSVMISTYDVAPQKLFGEENLAQSIVDAAARGVAIYIYYEHRPWYEKEDFKRFEDVASLCTRFEENANHSKCVIKDNELIAIGSYNWLSRSREESHNATIIITGSVVPKISKKIWEGVRFYQSLEYENEEGMQKFLQKESVFSPEFIEFSSGQFLYTLSTPEAHTEFLQDALHKARSRMLVFSPFVRLHKLQQIFTERNLHTLERNHVQMTLITLPSPCDSREEREEIFTVLRTLQERYENFSYLTYPNFHAKTLIVDQMICEGSYNWLSAVKHIYHDANNFEMSVALRGAVAESLLQTFETTNLGRRVLQHTRPVETSSVKVSKKRSLVQDSEVRRDTVIVEEKKKSKSLSLVIPEDFESRISIFSGESFGRNGYCVRFQDGKYLRSREGILYFVTSQQAKEAAYKFEQKGNLRKAK